MDGDQLDLFRLTIGRVAEAASGAALDAQLVEIGWHDALANDPRAAISVLFECQGVAGTTSSALDDVLAGALGHPGAGGLAVVLPAPGAWDPPATADGRRLSIDGLGSARLAGADAALVVAGGPAGRRAGALVSVVGAADLAVRPVRGMDPSLGLVAVRGSTEPTGPHDERGTGSWPAAVRLARLALGHQLVGAAGTMLELARAHALDREQFGRPIASFQAVRHRLAETLVAVEAGRAALDGAWEEGSPASAALAKAVAGRGARTAARHCQQVLAGIGFTTEHPFHRYLWRALVLDQLFGSTKSLTAQLGRDLLAGRPVPPPPPL